jgi:hypothetical protein
MTVCGRVLLKPPKELRPIITTAPSDCTASPSACSFAEASTPVLLGRTTS